MPRKLALTSAKAVAARGLTEPVTSSGEWFARLPRSSSCATLPSRVERPDMCPVRFVSVAE